jgi:hypothetical protein
MIYSEIICRLIMTSAKENNNSRQNNMPIHYKNRIEPQDTSYSLAA